MRCFSSRPWAVIIFLWNELDSCSTHFTLTWSSCSFQLLLTQSILAGVPGSTCSQLVGISCFPSPCRLKLESTLILSKWSEVAQLCPTLVDPMDSSLHQAPPPWDFQGKNTGVGCHLLFQGIFPTQGSNPGLLHWRQMLYCLSHQGSPCVTECNP